MHKRQTIMNSKCPIILILVLFITGCSINASNTQKTALLYNQFIAEESANIAQLNLFFKQMPKGGDLHHHYSGSIYAETYLDWVKQAGKCINKITFKIEESSSKKECITVDELRHNTRLHGQLLSLWSDKDYQNHFHLQPPPDANFFNTFGYFGKISDFSYRKGLNILKARAIKENVSYIETMLSSISYQYADNSFDKILRDSSNDIETLSSLADLDEKITDDALFNQRVNDFVSLIEQTQQGLDDEHFLMRYQTYASRNSSPTKVFSGLYTAFKAAEQSEYIVGVNIVGPENGHVALADYHLHMLMFAYLKSKFPNVNRALHAGELTLGMVRPKNLSFHIDQAINVAGAQRIGHGIDLPYEDNAIELLSTIKTKAAIEINLTSNEFILGVKNQQHPYLIYSAYDVPMIISTDDSGVSRNNLTNEYVLLASRYQPSYKKLKDYVYNSIKYSFLSEQFKDQLSKGLDARFRKFESEMSASYDLLFD